MSQIRTMHRTIRRQNADAAVNLTQRRDWHGPTPMTESQMQNLTNLGYALRSVFEDQQQATVGESLLNTLYNVDSSSRAVERNQGMGGFGNVSRFKGVVDYDGYEPNYQASYTHVEYDKGMAVERALIDDDEYGEIKSRATKLGMTFDRSIELLAASAFANAFSTTASDIDGTAITPTGPDGVALCSASHPNSPTDSATQSNTGTLALTHDNLITVKQIMRRFKDSRGNLMNVLPDTLVVPIELSEAADVIIASQQKSGTANNDTNVNRGYKKVVGSYLTDTNDWFLLDSRMAKLYLKWYWRVKPEFSADPTSDYNLVAKFRGYMRLSFGWDHWCWIYGNHL